MCSPTRTVTRSGYAESSRHAGSAVSVASGSAKRWFVTRPGGEGAPNLDLGHRNVVLGRTSVTPTHRREELVPSADDAAVAAWLGRLQDASFSRASQATRTAYPPDRRMIGTQLAEYLTRRTYALASTTRPDGRPHAAPTLFSLYAEAFWLPTVAGAVRLGNVRANPWLALSIIEGEHDAHAAVLTEGPAEVLTTVPDDLRSITELRNRGGSLDWATAWIRISPQRLFSFAEVAWTGVSA